MILMQQKLSDIAIYPKQFSESKILGAKVRVPFADSTVNFLNEISKKLMRDKRSREFSDIITLAFWIRKSNIEKLKMDFFQNHPKKTMLGRGIVFHIAPGNVAVNFAYSFFTGLLAGNNNIVKLAPKEFEQTGIVLDAIKTVCEMPEYTEIANGTAIVKYAIDDEITTYFSSICDARIMWGGDVTVNAIRSYPLPPRSTEIMFADRYSFSAIKADEVLKADDISEIALGFYNDTYLMDQNACSSPRMVVWQGADQQVEQAKSKFWNAVHRVVEREYQMEPTLVIDKYTRIFQDAIERKKIKKENDGDNLITRIQIEKLPSDVENIRCAGGYFVETTVKNLNEIAHIVNKKYQTMTYYGFRQDELRNFVMENSLRGIDRIVPMGQALAFGLIWDGYDLVSNLSRICDVL